MAGHQALIQWLRKSATAVQVCLEATGVLRKYYPCPDNPLEFKASLWDSGPMFRNTYLRAFSTLYYLNLDFIRFLGSLLQSRSALAAENLFLRKQLALYQERQVQPRRATDATRLTMVLASRLFDWKKALVSVQPETFTGWHRQGFKLLWRWESRPIGRPRIPKDLCQLILKMARDNPTWGPHSGGTSPETRNPSVPPHRSEVSAGGSEGWSTPGCPNLSTG
jgi:hypothetical protein